MEPIAEPSAETILLKQERLTAPTTPVGAHVQNHAPNLPILGRSLDPVNGPGRL